MPDVIQSCGYILWDCLFYAFADGQFLVVVADGLGVVAHAAEITCDPEKDLGLDCSLLLFQFYADLVCLEIVV